MMNYINKFTFGICFIVLMISSKSAFCQTKTWNSDLKQNPSFIENKGQFNGRDWHKDSNIEYGIDLNDFTVFFTKKGLTYRFDKFIRNPKRKKDDNTNPKMLNISELIQIEWIGANEEVEVITEEQSPDYYSYAIYGATHDQVTNINQIPGYKKLTYKNIYDNIDIEYLLVSDKGLKYSIILHPGANPSKVKLRYQQRHTDVGEERINFGLDESGQFVVSTSLGELTETHPYTYYAGSEQEIESEFSFENNVLSFELTNYDVSKEVVIDPWVQSPAFSTSTAVWEVETDGSGNIYVIGGETPMELKKYDISGNLQWTYTTPWDTGSVWLGTLATDVMGTCYITSGTAPEMERIDNAGSMVWHSNGGGGILDDEEWWSITFNCDKTRLIVGGTTLDMMAFQAYATIYDINLNTGAILGSQDLAFTSLMGFGATPIEVRSISSSQGSQYCFLTHNEVGAINQNIGDCPNDDPIFQVDNGHHLGYKCENYLPASQNGGGLKALVANDQYLYTHSGDQLYQRSLFNGTLINTVSIPGGASSSVPLIGGLVVENSGLDVDDCGNVYVGSTDRIIKYDQNLNILSEVSLPFSVYDISVNTNGEVLAVGAQFDNSAVNRNGKVQSIDMTACAQFSLTCCDANVCPIDPMCDDDAPITLTPSYTGGTWSGTGITDANAGIFDPSVAGGGTHIIVYSLACGSDSLEITVDVCATLEVCEETNGDLTVSGGTAPYTWAEMVDELDCSSCPFGNCMPPICNGEIITTYITFSTNATATPPATLPILITDANGNTLEITTLSGIPVCMDCPTISTTTVDPSCGGSDGSITINLTGGTGPFQYSIDNGSTTQGSNVFNGLAAGSYNIVVTDAGCTETAQVTLSSSNGPVIDDSGITINPENCTASDGNTTGLTVNGGATPYSYSWENASGSVVGTAINLSGVPAGTYYLTVTDANSCIDVYTTTVQSVTNPVTVDLGPDVSLCPSESVTLDAGAGYSGYLWTNGSSLQTYTANSAGTFSVTVTDASGCTGMDALTVTITSSLPADAGPDQSICSSSTATLVASGGSTYVWSNGESTQSISVSPTQTTTYYVTVSSGGCSAVDSVMVTLNGSINASITATVPSVCIGQSTQLQANGGTNYIWSTGDTDQIIDVAPLIASSYLVTVSDNSGCSGTAQIQIDVSDSITVIISPPEICLGESTQLTASVGGSYTWSTGDTTQSITVSPAVTTTYYVTVSEGSCAGSTDVTVTVNDYPIAEAGPDQDICAGDAVTLTASGGTSYQWNTGSTDNPLTISPTTTTTYFVTVTENNCSEVDFVNVMVTPYPVIDAGADQAICAGTQVTLSTSGADSYLWSNGESTASITVTPLTSTTYSVTASSSGCSASDDVSVTVNSIPTANAGADQLICSGNTATLVATGGTDYYWSTQSTNDTIIVSPSQTTSYSVVVSSNNCSSVDTVVVTVNDGVPASITASPSELCQSQSSDLTATWGTDFTYLWSTNETAQVITITPLVSTIYTVTINQGSCSSVADILISVDSSITATGSPTEICLGESANLTVSSGDSYIWSTGDTIQNIVVTPTVTTMYYVTVSSTICTDSTEVLVTVNDNPSVNVGPDQEICAGESVILTATGGDEYIWSNTMYGYSITVAPLSTTSYSVTANSSEGCSATDNMQVTVYPLPVANAGLDTLICQNESTPLVASGGTSYLWSPAASLNFDNIFNPTATPSNSTTYAVTVSDQNGCTDTDMVDVLVSPSLEVDVFVLALPSDSACAGDEIIFTAGGTAGGSNPVYSWMVNNNNVGSNAPTYASSMLADGDTVSCIFISSDVCAVNNPATDQIVVSIIPSPVISVSGRNLHGCKPLTVEFFVDGQAGYSYEWYFGDNGVSFDEDPVHTYDEEGIYDVTLIVSSNSSCTNSKIYSGLVEVYPAPEASFYPDTAVASIFSPQIFFINSSTGGYMDECIFGDGDTAYISSGNNFYHSYEVPGTFDVVLVAHSKHGCTDTAYTSVEIRPAFTFYAPSAFTPDGVNDNNVFYVTGSGIDVNGFELTVYDRWGEIIFESKNYNPDNPAMYGWNGRVKENHPAEVGVYTWLVKYKDLAGEEHLESGSVTLIR